MNFMPVLSSWIYKQFQMFENAKIQKKVLEMTHPKIHDDQPKPRFISKPADNVMLTEKSKALID